MERMKNRHLKKECPICGNDSIFSFILKKNMPVHCHLLWSTQAEAVTVPKGNLDLGFCNTCGHIYNYSFDPDLMNYTQAYENSLHFSPAFQEFANNQAQMLVQKHQLFDKDIIELGSGQGDFLKIMCKLGKNRGIGFDPSYNPKFNQDLEDRSIQYIQDFFSKKYKELKADFVISRHVLEHIEDPRLFLGDLLASLGNNYEARLYFEVPNVLYILRDLGIWDLIYEHCSYFCIHSLEFLLRSFNFNRCVTYETYGGQFLCIEAQRSDWVTKSNNQSSYNLRILRNLVEKFSKQYAEKISVWKQKIYNFSQTGKRVILWGSGSKGITFLNTLGIKEQIEYVVDINPRKQSKFVTGTGQKIIPPQFLTSYRPDVVLIMNPLYYYEIKQLLDGLGIKASLAVV